MQNNFFLKIKFSYPILFAVIINSAFADQDSIKAGEQKAMLCTACHGVEKSVNPEWPNLSQQSKKYLVDQLHAFRDGKRKNISVARGVISTRYTKEQVLRNINSAVAENWKPDEANIIEVTSKDNIVYVLHWAKDTDQVSGLPYEAYTITRFVFNEEGLVERIGNLSEDRFVLEQQGYTISR